jgi:hypothetical protein
LTAGTLSSSRSATSRWPAEPVAQHQHGALPGRQELHRRHVGEADALAQRGQLVGAGALVGQLVEQAVRVGLQVSAGVGARPAALLERSQADVGGDPV